MSNSTTTTSTDINNGWAVDFWVQTREPFARLFKKRAANQGWEIVLTSGKPKISIYDNNGLVIASARSFWRVDDGQWHEVAFNFNQDVNGIYLAIQQQQSESGPFEQFAIPGNFGSFQNDCNLQIQGYRGDVDMLRFFSGIEDPTRWDAIIQGFYGRSVDGNSWETFMGIGAESKVRFHIDEGIGSTVTDDKLGLQGRIIDPNHVRWYPYWSPFEDVSVQQHYRGNP